MRLVVTLTEAGRSLRYTQNVNQQSSLSPITEKAPCWKKGRNPDIVARGERQAKGARPLFEKRTHLVGIVSLTLTMETGVRVGLSEGGTVKNGIACSLGPAWMSAGDD